MSTMVPPRLSSPNHHIHVPIPGDHYTFLNGSAIMTLVYEFCRKHEAAGGRAQVLVARNSKYDYPAGECVPVDFGPWPDKRKKVADVALARIGLQRRFINEMYAPALDAIDPDFDGTIFIQNTPGPIRQFKAKRPKAQVCVHVHNALFDTYGSRELHRTVDAADLVICNCHFLANQLLSRLKHGGEKIRIVYNGVDTERFVPRPELVSKEEVVILFVGRMVPTKGADLLIDAALKVYGTGRRFKLRLIGNQGFSADAPLSPYEVELRRMAEPLGKCVEFLPFMDRHRILPMYQSANIFCAPSNYDEPCTLVLPEAMACGAPSIGSSRGGIPEMGKGGILYFDTPNTSQLADHFIHLIDDEGARAEWSRRARARAEELDWAVQYRTLAEAIAPVSPAYAHA